jgi:hypothetical protein
MPGRDRSQTFTRDGGQMGAFTWDYPGLSTGECTQAVYYCRDIVGEGDNHPFTVDKRWIEGGIINKPFDGYWSSWFVNYVADVARGPITDHVYTGAMATQVAATKAAAATNPSSPSVDLSVSIPELREIPELLRERTGRALRDAGSTYLTYKFGVVPLATDIYNLINLTESVDRKVRTIEELKRKGIRRTVRFGTWTGQDRIFRYVQTNGDFIGGYFDVETAETVSAHCRWSPGVELNQFRTTEAMRALATRAVTGSTIDLSTVWNLMPWSWLIDWFFSMGDYLEAHRNVIPAILTDVSVMRHRRTTEFWPGDFHTNIYGIPTTTTPIKGGRDTKQRATSFPSPFLAHLPFLNAGQVAIIGSLAASRSR